MVPDPKTRSLRLLLIEDHRDLAEMTAQFLRLAGMEVRITRSGAEALQTVAEFKPHIVLCDLRLPDMPGLDVAKRLRADPNCRDAMIAIHTAFSEREIEGLVSSSDDVDLLVPKPLTMKQIERLQTHWEWMVRSGRINPSRSGREI